MSTPKILWTVGDTWRRLDDLVTSRPVTIVTRNRTARLLDAPAGWQQRIPLPDGHKMNHDDTQQTLEHVTFASPCGVETVTADGDWHVTTRVIAVLAGHHPFWAKTQAAIDAQQRLTRSGGYTDHPFAVCPTPYCPANPRNGTPERRKTQT